MPPENNNEEILEAILQNQDSNAKSQEGLLENILVQNDKNNPEELLEAQLVQGDKNSTKVVDAIKKHSGLGVSVEVNGESMSTYKGEKGDKGDRGDTGKDAKGEKGDDGKKGDIGLRGIQGIQGVQGKRGGTGLTGTQGKEGVKGDTGEVGLEGKDGIDGRDGKTLSKKDIDKISKGLGNEDNLLWVNNGAVKSITAGSNITITGDDQNPTIASTAGGTVGPGTINELAYFDTTTSIASLDVATYPSLTELTYVKGVTSAIQTQINAKPDVFIDLTDTPSTFVGQKNKIAVVNDAETAVVFTYALLNSNGGTTVDSNNMGLSDGNGNTKLAWNSGLIRRTNGSYSIDWQNSQLMTSVGNSVLDWSTGAVNVAGLTASEIVGTNAGKDLVSLAVATYPSLTELAYVKGVTSAIQTQLDAASPMTTGGDIIYGGGSGVPTRLANGSAGEVLQSNGTTLAPTWVAAGAGDMTLVGIQSVTGLKTFDTSKLAMKGSSTGVTTVASANASVTSYIATLQAATGTLAYTADITGTNSGTNTGDQAASDFNHDDLANITGTAGQYNHPTNADMTVIGNTSGTNSGDQTISDATITTTDITTNDASITKHGFLKKLSNVGTEYMNGTGAWSVPAGGGDMTLAGIQSVTGLKTFDPSKLAMKGSSSGVTTIASANASVTSYTATLQAATGTLAYTADITGTNSGTNTGDQTSIVGITGTIAQFNTELSDGSFATGGGTATGTNTGDEVAASLTAAGVIEIATPTEVNTGTDDTRAVSPVGLTAWTGDTALVTLGTIGTGTWQGTAINQTYLVGQSGTNTGDEIVATDAAQGTVELATDAEMTTGTATNRAITPANAKVELDKKLALAGGTTSGDITLGEGTSIALDPAGSADGKYSGTTFTATAGETFAFGDVVYLKAADSEWYLADASVVGTSGTVAIAFAVSSGADAGACTLMSAGIIRADAGFPALTIGAPVYISITGTTTNTVTVTAPTATDEVIKILGYALTANEVLVNISPDHITVT